MYPSLKLSFVSAICAVISIGYANADHPPRHLLRSDPKGIPGKGTIGYVCVDPDGGTKVLFALSDRKQKAEFDGCVYSVMMKNAAANSTELPKLEALTRGSVVDFMSQNLPDLSSILDAAGSDQDEEIQP